MAQQYSRYRIALVVWVLIIIQFALYFSIFIAGYQRSKVFGLNKNIALVLFILLAVLGRVNDWELIIIPLLVVIMLVFSTKNKKVSEKGQSVLTQNKDKLNERNIRYFI